MKKCMTNGVIALAFTTLFLRWIRCAATRYLSHCVICICGALRHISLIQPGKYMCWYYGRKLGPNVVISLHIKQEISVLCIPGELFLIFLWEVDCWGNKEVQCPWVKIVWMSGSHPYNKSATLLLQPTVWSKGGLWICCFLLKTWKCINITWSESCSTL